MKICACCKETKDLCFFGTDNARLDKKNPYCKECVNDRSRRYYYQNTEKHYLSVKAWKDANPEKVAEILKRCRDRRAYHVSKFGLTPEEYEEILVSQNNVCFICGGRDSSGRRLCVDHCHECGNIRHLLCTKCNGLLGWLESRDILQNVIDYISKDREKNHGA